MKRLVVLNRYFYPDHSATSQILTDLAFHLAATGRQVQIITSPLRYDRHDARLAPEEYVNGVRISRVATTAFGRAALSGRAVDYASFYASAYRLLRKILKPGDILLAMTDPPLLSIPAARAAKSRGAHLVNWLQDLYPEVAIELGVRIFNGRLGNAVSYMRDRSLRSAVANIVVGARMADKLRDLQLGNIHIIHNWTDDKEIAPLRAADNPFRHLWGLQDKFVVGYSGNLGRAHEFETLLAASRRLRTHPHIVFLFIGGGHGMDALAAQVKAQGLEASFRFIPYQDRSLLKQSLGVPDLHWLSLKPELEGLIVPSKFYGIAAAGRPTLAVTAPDGEIAKLVRDHHCGLVVAPGRGDELAASILRLSNSPTTLAEMGNKARAMLDEQFTRRQAFERWRKILGQIDADISLNAAKNLAS
jgi:colanic acid biosynthesis glycosyl transferase WcaI